MHVYVQETVELFEQIQSLGRSPPSAQKTQWINVLLECELVELVQKIWRDDLDEDDLDEDLPDHVESSLGVSLIHISHLCILHDVI